MVVKIAFSGTQGTGKSFSAYQKVAELKLHNPTKSVVIVNELATDSPFPINNEATRDSQLWIFTRGCAGKPRTSDLRMN